MSLTRVHNFSISLDGFGTGEGQSHDAPFGHAGERLHDWMFATRFPTGGWAAGWVEGGTRGGEGRTGERREGWIDLPAGLWHDQISGAHHPGGPTPSDQLLATLPHALLVRS